MASLITTISGFIFPHEVDNITVSATEQTAVKIDYNGKTVLDVQLYPIDGTIELQGIASLLQDWMDAGLGELTIYLNGTGVRSVSVIPCTLHLDRTAEEGGNHTFLTRATCRYTHADAKELLHYPYPELTDITIKAVIRKDGVVSILTKTEVSSDSADIVTYDVSPRVLFDLDAYEVMEYTVQVYENTVRYRMIPDGMADTLHEFGFINSFMQEEYITLTGEAERELKVERLHAYVGGQYRNFQVDVVPHWTIHSGVLLDGMQGLFDDFISSKKIWRKSDNVMMAVTSSDYKTKDSSTALNGGTVTLRETGRTYRHRLQRPVKTFDETFDDTFQ